MPIIETEQQTNQNVISGQEYLDAGATKELVGQLRGYAEGYNDGYDAGAAAGGGSGGGITLYAWKKNLGGFNYYIYTATTNPSTDSTYLFGNNGSDDGAIQYGVDTIVDADEDAITFSSESVYTRYAAGDITL